MEVNHWYDIPSVNVHNVHVHIWLCTITVYFIYITGQVITNQWMMIMIIIISNKLGHPEWINPINNSYHLLT